MHVVIYQTAKQVCAGAARRVAERVRRNPCCVLALPTGNTPLAMYKQLVSMYARGEKQNEGGGQRGIDFTNVVTFNLDEYVMSPEHPASYRSYMQQHLVSQVNLLPENVHVPDPTACDLEEHCRVYEKMITAAGGVDLAVLGIGRNGHIAFNEPFSPPNSRTRVITLAEGTRIANAFAFDGDVAKVPKQAISMGIGTLLTYAQRCLVLACGAQKAEAVRDAIEGPIRALCPASFLQMHDDATFLIDAEAAKLLEHRQYYEQPGDAPEEKRPAHVDRR